MRTLLRISTQLWASSNNVPFQSQSICVKLPTPHTSQMKPRFKEQTQFVVNLWISVLEEIMLLL